MSSPEEPNPRNRYDRVLDVADLSPNTSYARILSLAEGAETVLDVGCNTGYLGRMFIERGARVAGIDNDHAALERAAGAGIVARWADLDSTPIESVFRGEQFDLVVFADVLEHLKHPDRVLRDTSKVLTPGGHVIASIPNVAHGNVRLDLLLGRFEYTAIGLLDNTHLRFFTAETIGQLFADSGYEIDAVERVTCPVDSVRIEEAVASLGLPGTAPELLSLLSSESSSTFQYVVRAACSAGPVPTENRMFWTMGDRERPVGDEPAYLAVDSVPNAVTDMRQVIKGLKRAVADKDEILAGLEASLAETQEYLATVIRDKDGVIGGLEASIEENRGYFDSVIEDREHAAERLRDGLRQERVAVAELSSRCDEWRKRYEGAALPTVTVVVVNWNGEALLAPCLQSLRDQSYPDERYRVVVVDNASSDESVKLVKDRFPEVEVLASGTNLGFAAGNNLAIRATTSDYVALLNNDAIAEQDWLRRLVGAAEADAAIGAVSSKVLLMHDRLPLTVEVDGAFVPGPHDQRRVSARISTQATIDGAVVPMEFITGAFGPEEHALGTSRWLTSEATLRVPIHLSGVAKVVLRLLPSAHPAGPQPRIRFRAGDRIMAEACVPAHEAANVDLVVCPGDLRPLIQNAGSVILPDGAGSDRGSIVVGGQAFYDIDRGQFDVSEDVPAFCGAAALLRRSALEEAGAFDDSFFMYYEDTDLSLRLRRLGWRVVYEPGARVRHHHSATSIEWSPRFCYFVERNRLLTLLKNGPPGKFMQEYGRYTTRLARSGETEANRKRFLLVQRSLLSQAPKALLARRGLRGRTSRAAKAIAQTEFGTWRGWTNSQDHP